jgi:hypothetical protein
MDVELIDPRDIGAHVRVVAWRVYFYRDMGPGHGMECAEHRVTGKMTSERFSLGAPRWRMDAGSSATRRSSQPRGPRWSS